MAISDRCRWETNQNEAVSIVRVKPREGVKLEREINKRKPNEDEATIRSKLIN
jgi:hypothetical protein